MNKLFCFLGESAVGKDTIVKELLKLIEKEKLPIKQLMSRTTRPLRDGEKNGCEYWFETPHKFNTAYKNNEVVEYNTYKIDHIGQIWFYYTLREDLKLLNDYNCIKVINPLGFCQLNQVVKNQVVSFKITAPVDIRRKRYEERGSVDDFSSRLERDNKDFAYLNVNYTINNDGKRSVEDVAKEVLKIIKKEISK